MPGWRRRRTPPRRFRSRLASLLLMLVLFGAAAYLAAHLDPLPPRFSGVAQAADGDSLRLRGDRIRLLGIDAPERDQICWESDGSEWRCGEVAHQRLAELVRGEVSCQPDGTDRYGRILATCTASGRDLAAVLVVEGLAVARDGYGVEAARARIAGRGIWRGRFLDPREWRDEGPAEAPEPPILENLWNWFRELTGATTLR